jgi:steroid delta-isomerase-like uncharacterized protein
VAGNSAESDDGISWALSVELLISAHWRLFELICNTQNHPLPFKLCEISTPIAKGIVSMTPDENKRFIRCFVEETINRKDLHAIDGFVAKDFIEHVPFHGQGPGRDGLRDAIGTLLSAFPDMQWIMDEQVGEGEKVVSRFSWTGTHRGEFLGIPPTGKSVKVWGIVMDLVRDGVLSESRIIMDTLGLLQQLGTIPAPEVNR